MTTKVEGYSTSGDHVLLPSDHADLPVAATLLVTSDDKKILQVDKGDPTLSDPSPNGDVEIHSSFNANRKGKGRHHRRRRRNHKSNKLEREQRWKMIAGMSSIALSQQDYEIYRLAKTLESNGIAIPKSSLLHPSSSSKQQTPNDAYILSGAVDNLNCCPSYQFTYKSSVGVDVYGGAVFLAGYGEDYNSPAIQTFHGTKCFPHVVNKPCRFLFQLHPDAICVQKYSYTRALKQSLNGDAAATADIRVPGGCQCEIPV